jgi:hypothetical protein
VFILQPIGSTYHGLDDASWWNGIKLSSKTSLIKK